MKNGNKCFDCNLMGLPLQLEAFAPIWYIAAIICLLVKLCIMYVQLISTHLRESKHEEFLHDN